MALCGAKDHIASFSAITAIRPATRHKLFPPETYATAPAMTGFNVDFCFINKFHVKFFLGEKAYTISKSKMISRRLRKRPYRYVEEVDDPAYAGQALPTKIAL